MYWKSKLNYSHQTIVRMYPDLEFIGKNQINLSQDSTVGGTVGGKRQLDVDSYTKTKKPTKEIINL